VTTDGSASTHQEPPSSPRRLAPPSCAPAWPAGTGCVLCGWVLGEVTAGCLPVGSDYGP
jgi:hypothetical protein